MGRQRPREPERRHNPRTDPRGQRLTPADVERIVNEARNRGERPDLVGADLVGADLGDADLGDADLRGAHLWSADLRDADLANANLANANLSRAKLRGAHLRDADLSGADLSGADLVCADLVGAHLVGADLRDADLRDADLRDADLRDAKMGGTSITLMDLSCIEGLAEVEHRGSSLVSVDTLERTAKGLAGQPESRREEVFVFLRGAGLNDDILGLVRSWIAKPIEFYSCFISYSHADREFARLLYDTLQGRGVRCWLDEHQLLAGDNLYDVVDRGIRLWDKVLLCCSEAALTSWWVDKELGTALEKEQRLQRERGSKVQVVIPLDLDGYLLSWQGGKGATLRERYAPPFSGWQHDAGLFGARVDNVMRALRSDDGGREPPPPPKL